VAEDDSALGDAGEQLRIGWVGLGGEAAHVRERRRMAVAHVVEDHLLGQPCELRDRIGAHQVGAASDGVADGLGDLVVVGLGGPAVDVAADPGRIELVQAGHGLRRPGAEDGVIASEQETVGPVVVGVGEHGLERREVAVNVVEEGQHAAPA
jgi:hypothetical protein